MIKKISFLWFILLVLGCNPQEQTSKGNTSSYVGIAEILDEQVGTLLASSAGLEKQVTSNGTKEILEVTLEDSAAWKSQLQLFYDADISRPGYTGAYFVEELPASSGSSKKIYTARKKKRFVRVMECTYQGDLLQEVRLELTKRNEVFSLDQELFLFFTTESGKSRLSSFSIEGQEQMKLKQGLSFSVVGTIVWP